MYIWNGPKVPRKQQFLFSWPEAFRYLKDYLLTHSKKKKIVVTIIFITTIFGYAAPGTFDLKTGVIRWMEIIELISFSLTVIAFVILMCDLTNNLTIFRQESSLKDQSTEWKLKPRLKHVHST